MFGKFLFQLFVVVGALTMMASASVARADSFGTGGNAFDIDFVTISGSTNPTDTSPTGGYGIVADDYRMGVHEITNDQWNKFEANLGVPVTGDRPSAYDESPYWTGTSIPTNEVSWYEAAQFANWLNTSTSHQPAYKFTGTQGTGDYALGTWTPAEAAGGTNLYRHKDAFYFLPTEDEWVKAAYWNGTTLQDHATKAGESPTQGDGTSGTGWNYYDDGYATDPSGPWDVGSGSEELNGTYDMMGNIYEWTESPYSDPNYGVESSRSLRGGGWDHLAFRLHASDRNGGSSGGESSSIGFRVASVPEPGSITLLGMGTLALLAYAWRRRRWRWGQGSGQPLRRFHIRAVGIPAALPLIPPSSTLILTGRPEEYPPTGRFPFLGVRNRRRSAEYVQQGRTHSEERRTMKRLTVGVAVLVAVLIGVGQVQADIISWGYDDSGQVTDTPSETDFTAIAAGFFHSLALKSDKSIVSWGDDYYDQVTDTPSGTDFTAIAGGGNHSLALKSDKSIVSWGYDYYDQVTDTPSGTDFTAIAGGGNHSLALKSDKSIVSWGQDDSGEVTDTPGGTDFTAIAGGLFHSLALKSDKSIVSWGNDSVGQVTDTPGGTDFIAVAAGAFHSLALRSDGAIVSWGADSYGQVTNTPGGTDFTAIAGGANHSLALKSDRSIVSWGDDSAGLVTDTPGGTDFTAIAAGGYHSLAIPEPSTLVLLSMGTLALLAYAWRRQRGGELIGPGGHL